MDPLYDKLGITDPLIIGQTEPKATLGLYLENKFKEAWTYNPTQSVINTSKIIGAADDPPQDVDVTTDEMGLGSIANPTTFEYTKPRLTREEWKETDSWDPRISFDEMTGPDGKVSVEKAQLVKQLHDEDLARKTIIERGPEGFIPGSLGLLSSFAASVVDPINLATAFIPIVPAGTWALRLGRTGSLLARGAIDGAVGNTLAEPFVHAAARAGQLDYTYWDSGVNLLMGAALGAGLHAGLGRISDALEIRSLPDQEARMRATLVSAEKGYPVDMAGFMALSKLEKDSAPHIRELPTIPKIVSDVDELYGGMTKQSIIEEWYRKNAVDDNDLVSPALWGKRADDFVGKLPFSNEGRAAARKLFKGASMSDKEIKSLKKEVAGLFNNDAKKITDTNLIDTLKVISQDYLLNERAKRMSGFEEIAAARTLTQDILDKQQPNPGSAALTPEEKFNLGKTRAETITNIKNEVKAFKDQIRASELNKKTYVVGRREVLGKPGVYEDLLQSAADKIVTHIEQAETRMQLAREKRAPLIKAVLDELMGGEPGFHGDAFVRKDMSAISPDLKHSLAVDLGGTKEADSFMKWILYEYNNKDKWTRTPEDMKAAAEAAEKAEQDRLYKQMSTAKAEYVGYEPPKEGVFTGAKPAEELGGEYAKLYENIFNSMDYVEYVNLRAMAHSQMRVAGFLSHIEKAKEWASKNRPGDEKYKINVVRDAIDSYLWGTGTKLPGARASMDAFYSALSAKYQGGLLGDLEKIHLFEKMYDTSPEGMEFNRKVARELWEFDKPGFANKSITGDKDAFAAAEVIHKYQDMVVDRLNRSGTVITKLPGYIVKQSHNREKISRLTYDEWKKEILPRLDQEATFKFKEPVPPRKDIPVSEFIKDTTGKELPTPEKIMENLDNKERDIDEFLKSVYDNIVSGKYTVFDNESDVSIKDNLGARVSAKRRLFFKSADDWFDYNKEYGNSPYLLPTVQHGLERATKNLAVIEYLGPTPKAVLNSVVKYMKKDMSGSVKGLGMLERRSNEWSSAVDEMLGLYSIPANPTIGKIGAGARAIQNMSKLGSAALSAVTDVPFFAAEMRYQGDSLLHAYYTALTNVLKGRRGGQQKEIARMLGVGLDGIRGTVLTRFVGPDEAMSGKIGWMNNKFFQASGLNWWTDAQKEGFGLMVSHYLANNADTEFGSLNKGLKRTLELYDISEKDWDTIRTKGLENVDGTNYLLPEKLLNLEDGRLEEKLRMYIIDSADRAIPTPGLRERMMLKGGILGGEVSQAGTVWGEAVRLFSQFKSFPLTVVRKILGREVQGDWKNIFRPGNGEIIGGLAHLMITTTVLGYMSMAMKDFFKGKQLKDPLEDYNGIILPKWSTWTAAFVQGGGLGIMSDFMFSLQSRYGQGALETFMGPSFSSMNDFYNVYASIRDTIDNGIDPDKDTKEGKFANAGIQALKNNLPYINLFYIRGLLDFAITRNLQESLSPGYQTRVQNQLQKEYGQEYFVETPGYLNLEIKGKKIFEHFSNIGK